LGLTMPVLEVDGGKITCNVKRKDIRHVYLRLKPNLQLEVNLPYNTDISVDGILEKKRPWIERKVREISEAKKIFNGDSILYKGEYIKVKAYVVKRPRKKIRLYRKVMLIYEGAEIEREAILADFITRQTLEYIQQKAAEFAEELGVTYDSISTKGMKKWGYCTRGGALFFNWKLICLPRRLVDYIVFHELLHLKHFNHSRQFRKDMARHFLDYKELEAMLRSYIAN